MKYQEIENTMFAVTYFNFNWQFWISNFTKKFTNFNVI